MKYKDLYDALASKPFIMPDIASNYTIINPNAWYNILTPKVQKSFNSTTSEQLKPVENNKEINNKMSVRKETKTTITPKTNYYQLDYYKDSKISGWKLIPKISEIKEYNGNTVKIKFADDSFETAVLSADDEEARLEAALAICYLKKMLDCGGKGEYGTNAFNKLLNIMLKQIEKQKKDAEKVEKEKAEKKALKERKLAKKQRRLARYKKKKTLNE